MLKRPKITTSFSKQMAAEAEISAARARGRVALADAAESAKKDRAYRAAKKLEQPFAARDRERAKVNGPLQDRTGWHSIEVGSSSAT